jgi:hypothetical protein
MLVINIPLGSKSAKIKDGDCLLRIGDLSQNLKFLRGISSVGRALRSHRRGHRFESGILHLFSQQSVYLRWGEGDLRFAAYAP